MFCQQCGAQLNPEGQFCSRCGAARNTPINTTPEQSQVLPTAGTPGPSFPAPGIQTAGQQKKPLGCWSIGCLTVVAIVIISAIIGALAPSTTQHSAVVERPQSRGSSHAVHQIAAPPPPVHHAQVVADISGSGIKSTQRFNVPDDWDLYWTYDCSNFENHGNFIVMYYDSSGIPNEAVNELGSGGSDVTHLHNGGDIYLEVNSECDWHIKAVIP
jgi:hypothetical protein